MRHLRAASVVVCGVLLTSLSGCALVGVPVLFLNAKNIYTASPVVIPYTFSGPSASAWCTYTLYKVAPGPAPTTQVGSPVTRLLSSSGNLVVDIAGISGSSVVDGSYQMSFAVLGGSNDQNTIPTLTQSVSFSVQTQPFVQSTTPAVINTTALPASLTLTGWNLGSTPVTVTAYPGGSSSVTGTVSSSSSNQIILSPFSASGPGIAYIQVNTGTASSPPYMIPVVAGSPSLSAVTPSNGSSGNSALQVVIQGSNFAPYTGIGIVDGGGNPIPFTVAAFSGGNATNLYASYFVLSLDLSHSTPGQGSVVLQANDGTGYVTVPWPFYVGG